MIGASPVGGRERIEVAKLRKSALKRLKSFARVNLCAQAQVAFVLPGPRRSRPKAPSPQAGFRFSFPVFGGDAGSAFAPPLALTSAA